MFADRYTAPKQSTVNVLSRFKGLILLELEAGATVCRARFDLLLEI